MSYVSKEKLNETYEIIQAENMQERLTKLLNTQMRGFYDVLFEIQKKYGTEPTEWDLRNYFEERGV